MLYYLLAANFLAASAISIYLTIVHAKSEQPEFNANYIYLGYFDLETWACALKAYYPQTSFGNGDVMGKQCSLSKSGRLLSIILNFLSLTLGACIILDWRFVKSIVCDRRKEKDFVFE
jgi:hypothetical protein